PFEGTPAPVPKNTNSTFFPPALYIIYLSSYGMLFQMANRIYITNHLDNYISRTLYLKNLAIVRVLC
ncbi:hypothetical protein OFM97_26260, partial [Escherichia coli]|nr:hypothetical protein [Escherichia coli]